MPMTREEAEDRLARVPEERTKLALVSGARPPTSPVIRQAAVNRWQRTSMAGLTPERLAAILRRVERGDTEDWVDLCSYMLRVDGHLRSVYDTRRIAVAGARWAVEPGFAKTPEEEALAQDAADLCAENLDRLPRLESTFEHLLHGEGVGWSGLEHVWKRVHGVWLSYPHAIHARDIEPYHDWSWKFRTYEDGRIERWVCQREENPARFLVHVPGGIGEVPTLAGDLHAVAWMFVFKHWALLFRQTGLERNANAFLFGITPPSSPPEARDKLFDGLQRLSGDQVAAFEALPNGQVPVQLLESTRTAADNWNPAIESMNAEMSKALLGSTINVEVLHAGGNRALGESQFSTTILPRMHRSARALESTIEMQWFRWLLEFNSHLFGNRIPPTPRLRLKLVADDKPVITDLHVGAGVVDANELRESAGLPAWEGEQGTRIAQPVAKQSLPAEHRQSISPAPPQTVSSSKRTQLTLPHTKAGE